MPKPFVVVATAALAAVSACAPGSTTPKSTPKPKPTAKITVDISKFGKVTLTVWDQEVLGGQNDQMERLNAAFHAAHPNVTIKRVSRSFSDLNKTLRLALSGKNPPDVVEANQGYGTMAALVKAGALAPLDSYDKLYGFRKRYPAGLNQINSVTSKGKAIGSGSLYGVSMAGEAVGIYYNTDKLAQLGLRPPTTWAQFLQDLAVAKNKGQTPLYFANQEKFPAIHEFGVLLGEQTGTQLPRDLVFGHGTWADPAVVRAVQQLANWAAGGYFEKGFDSEKYNDSPTPFAKGEGVFMIGGPWFAADLRKKMGDKVRYMLPPPARVGGTSATLGGPGLPLAITAKSKHPDVAAAYLDFMTSPQAMNVVQNTGGLPAIPPATAKPATPIAQDLATAWKNVSAHDSLIPYLDYSTPTFLDTLGGVLQEILAGKKDAKQGMQDAQKDYQDFLSNR